MTGHKANLARQRRRDGDILGYVRGIMAPDVLSQILRIRWRTFILDRRAG
jgi:hypothetical protein